MTITKKQIMSQAALANIKALDSLIKEIAEKVKKAKNEALVNNTESLCSASTTMGSLSKDLETARLIHENYEAVLMKSVMYK